MRQKAESVSLESRFEDLSRLARSGGRVRFMGFLDEKEACEAQKLSQRQKSGNTFFWGGYPEAERVMLGVFPDFMEPDEDKFQITAVTCLYRKGDNLSHRDFLGALLHAGIERSALGDLLIEEGRCVFFCRSEISGFLLSQVTKIGGVGVKLSQGFESPLPYAHHFEDWTSVIASARLDCAVAAVTSTSREKAAQLVRAGLVQLNHETVSSVSESVGEGDKLSVRGKGRFVLDQLGPFTKKGRLMIRGRKYL